MSLGFGRQNGFPRQYLYLFCRSANTLRYARRTDAFTGQPLKGVFDDPVLKRMKGYDRENAVDT
jgi:hypothetical protein